MSQPVRLDFKDFDDARLTRPWVTVHERFHDLPTSYRQPKWQFDPNDPYGDLDVLQKMMYQKDANTGQVRPQYQLPRMVFECFDRIEDLKAMADSRNTSEPMIRNQRVDIQDMGQARMTMHVRQLIVIAFAQGLYTVMKYPHLLNRSNWMDFINDWPYRGLLHQCAQIDRIELVQQLRLQANQGQLHQEFGWLRWFGESVDRARRSMVGAFRWAQHHESDQTAAFKQALMDTPEMTRLIMILLEREKSFNDVLSQEHLFGCLYDKCIRLFGSDSFRYIWNNLYAGTADFDKLDEHLGIYQNLNPLYRELHGHQTRLRKLHDYQTTIGSWNRMWHSLHVVINPEMNISDAAVDQFIAWAGNDNNPMERNFFGIHPIKRSQIQDEQCTICLNSFVDGTHLIGTVVLRTKCGHYFHPKCIFTHWDRPGYWKNLCPMCRQPAGNLRDVIDGTGCRPPDTALETVGAQGLHDTHYTQVADRVNQNLLIPEDWTEEVLDAYWQHRIAENTLAPMRAEREAEAPSWDDVLGA